LSRFFTRILLLFLPTSLQIFLQKITTNYLQESISKKNDENIMGEILPIYYKILKNSKKRHELRKFSRENFIEILHLCKKE